MKITTHLFILSALIFSSVPVFALGTVVRPRNLHQNLHQVNSCSSCNIHRHPECAQREVIMKAAYMGQDDRETISRNKEKVGFSDQEVERIKACTGHIFCPGADFGNGGMQSAGAICAPGQRRNGVCPADRLGTVAHLFLNEPAVGQDPAQVSFIPDVGQCTFYGYKGHESKLVVSDVTPVISPSDRSLNPLINDRNEGLAIRLETPIPGCDPMDLADSSVRLAEGTQLTVVSFPNVDQSIEEFPDSEPLAFKCNIKRMFDQMDGKSRRFWTDCDLNGIGSGAFGLVRQNGNLVVASLFIKAAGTEHNGQAYNEDAGIFTTAISVTDYFRKLAESPGRVPTPWGRSLEPAINSRPVSN